MCHLRQAFWFSQCSPSQRLVFWKCWKGSPTHLSPESSSTMVKDLRSTFCQTVSLLHLGNGSNALSSCRDITDLLTQLGEYYREVSRHRPADSITSEARMFHGVCHVRIPCKIAIYVYLRPELQSVVLDSETVSFDARAQKTCIFRHYPVACENTHDSCSFRKN